MRMKLNSNLKLKNEKILLKKPKTWVSLIKSCLNQWEMKMIWVTQIWEILKIKDLVLALEKSKRISLKDNPVQSLE